MQADREYQKKHPAPPLHSARGIAGCYLPLPKCHKDFALPRTADILGVSQTPLHSCGHPKHTALRSTNPPVSVPLPHPRCDVRIAPDARFRSEANRSSGRYTTRLPCCLSTKLSHILIFFCRQITEYKNLKEVWGDFDKDREDFTTPHTIFSGRQHRRFHNVEEGRYHMRAFALVRDTVGLR